MLVDIRNKTLILQKVEKDLKPNQISQIIFWGFKKSDDNGWYKIISGNFDISLLKLLKYLEKEKIEFKITPDCKIYLEKIRQDIDRFETIKKIGRQYKDGSFDSMEFDEFISFANNRISRKLKDHQLKAAFHLFLVGNGANFSVPGSGKTAVVLSVYEKLKAESKVDILFIIGPPSCFGPWRNEFKYTLGRNPAYKIFAGGIKHLRKIRYIEATYRHAEMYLTTFQTLLNDQREVEEFFRRNNVFLVIDEAHYIKQLGGNWAKAVLHIANYATYRCVLTGTPLPRSYTDLFNLFDFLWPQNKPISPKIKSIIQLQEERNNLEIVKNILEENIGALFYRVRKRDLGLMPQLFHPPIVINMNKYEKIIYDAVDKKIRDYNKEDYLKNIELVQKLRRGRILRLRQCVSYIKLLFTTVEDYKEKIVEDNSDLSKIIYNYDRLEKPAKIEYLLKIVKEMQAKKQKVVIWSNFIMTLKLIARELSKAGFFNKLIYGDIPIEKMTVKKEETREKIINEFIDLNSGLNILIANPAACAESISLHKTCFHSIYYDLSYNCAQYLQSLDRIHRVGGSENNQANYYFLQYINTIDQNIKLNLEKKAEKMYALIEADYGIYSLDMFEDAAEEELMEYERIFK